MGEHKQDWFKELVVYQIYPRSFQDSDGDGIGDLRGICMRLDYLAELGVNAIWLCPVYASPNVDNGYDVSDYRQIMKEFGNMEDWDVLLKEAHGRNIAVIMDLVLNHTSDQHEWFLQSRQSRDNPYSDYYIWMDPGPDGPPSAWQSSFGGSAWEYVPERGQYYLHSFSKEQPDLNWKNPQVRQEIDQLVQWWVNKGVDGFRIDAISYLDKRLDQMQPADSRLATVACVNSPGTHQFIHEFIEKTCAPGHLMTVGEVTCNTKQDYWDYAAKERGEFDMVIPFVQPVEELKTWSPMKMKQNITDTYEGLKESGWWARFLPLLEKHEKIISYARKLGQTEWVMVHYFGRTSYELDLDEAGIGGTVILTNYGRSGGIEGKIRLEPYETFCICKSE